MDLLDERHTRGFSAAQISPLAERGLPFLEPSDRKLVEMVLTGRLSRREIATLVGVPVQTVSRRMLRLYARLHDPLVLALIEQGQLLPELYRDVGLAYFLRRWNVPRIAREYQVTQYQARRTIQYIKGWHAARRNLRASTA